MGKMAKGIHFTGTIGNICFYEVGDRTYVRIKSSLTRKRVLTDKKFAPTRKYASDMGRAARIASPIYKALPADVKGRWIFRAITGEAASLLYQGKEEKEVKDILWRKYIADTDCTGEAVISTTTVNISASSKKANRLLHDLFLSRWEKQGKPARWFKRAWREKHPFNPITIPRRSEYFLGMRQAARNHTSDLIL